MQASPELVARYKRMLEYRNNRIKEILGIAFSHIGESILKDSGHETDFKINGYSIVEFAAISKQNPEAALEILKNELQIAIENERFERAALIRDQIKQLKS